MKNLHHAIKELGNKDIPCIQFESVKEMMEYIEGVFDRDNQDRVYIFTYDTGIIDSEVFITNSFNSIDSFISCNDIMFDDKVDNYFLQEYSSYEDAYEVSLTMKELNELCYN